MAEHADGDALAGGESPNLLALDYHSVEGLITNEEADALCELAKKVPDDGLIVNIGTWKNKSVACLKAGAPFARIVTMDIDHSKADPRMGDVDYVTCDSGRRAHLWRHPIDLLFVDGNHSYGAVTRDTAYCQHVKVFGRVAFHDYDAFQHEVTYAVDDWWAEHRCQFHKVACTGYLIVYERIG